MHQNFTTKDKGARFFELLAEADEIKIREMNQAHVDVTFDKSEQNAHTEERFFIVKICKVLPISAEEAEIEIEKQSRDSLLQSANLLLNEKDFVLARNIFSYLVKRDTRDQVASLGLGICLVRLGEISSAIKCLKQVESEQYEHRVNFWLGNCHIATHNDGKAIEYFERIPQANSLHRAEKFDLYKELGNCRLRQDDVEGAWSYYHKAIQIDPSSAILYTNLGFLELQRSNPAGADSYFKKAIELEPQNSKAYGGLGTLSLHNGNVAEAKQRFEQAVTCDSSNTFALQSLIQLNNSPSDYVNLEAQLRVSLEKDPNNLELQFLMGVVLFKQEHWNECNTVLNKILQERPDHRRARKLKDDVKERLEHEQDAA